MNRQRRKDISDISAELKSAIETLEEIKDRVEAVRDEEQEYRENMPDSIGDGEKGEQADAAISQLEEVLDAIETLVDVDPCAMLDEAAG